ncbi:MAG: ATP-binding protein [Candidatus Cloacimonetes bacterium]|nr:ATP-binding protein [Candidatus Cloacimonadota bacterium]
MLKRICTLCILLEVLGLSGLAKTFPTHRFAEEWSRRPDTPYEAWTFADLGGDARDEFVYKFASPYTGNQLMINDLNLKPISQATYTDEIRSPSVLTDPSAKDPWLFFTLSDNRRIQLRAFKYTWTKPLQREERVFEPIFRNDPYMDMPSFEWLANLGPVAIIDLDDDGNLELVCNAADGYSAYPRGLYVYDFESGKLKWKYDSPTGFVNVLVDDFDQDGTLEIVIGTTALKNTDNKINGLDDYNGWLLVLDRTGKLIWQEKVYQDYGSVYLHTKDINADGKPEIFKTIATWGAIEQKNSVEILSWNGSRMISQKKFELESPLNRLQTKYYADLVDSGKHRIFLSTRTKGLIVLDENLNKVKHNFDRNVKYILAFEDLRGAGSKDIILQTDDGYFVILNEELKEIANLKNPFPEAPRTSLYAVNKGFGEPKLIALVSANKISFYSLKRYPLHVLLHSFLEQYWEMFTLALMFILFVSVYSFYKLHKHGYAIMETCDYGIVISSSKGKILFVNKYLLELLTLEAKRAKQLRMISPELADTLDTFHYGKFQLQGQDIQIQTQRGKKEFTANIINLKRVLRRYLILLTPQSLSGEILQDKLEWADLARRLSHHVRRHIANIVLAIEPLTMDTRELDKGSSQEREELLRIVKNEINQIKTFTHAFQRFTQLKDYDLKDPDVVPSIEHCLARIVIPPKVTVIKDWNLKSVFASIEPIRFEEALQNLIINALDSMEDGGSLQIGIKEFPLHAAKLGKETLSVLVEIEDSGNGIPAQYLEEIWQPFFTTKQSGTGIGLPESRKIIESMKGELSIQSEPGVGTIVSIWLKGKLNG